MPTLQLIDRFIMPIRMSEWEELVGADFAEHGIRRRNVGVSRAVSVLGLQHNGFDYSDIMPQGDNPCTWALGGCVWVGVRGQRCGFEVF